MAFDGITIASIVKEMNDSLVGGRIYKIAQPEADELILTVKNNGGQKRLFISADASLPLIYMTDYNKTSPMTAPNFCMLLRKHIQNARILSIIQPEMERIVRIELEHLNELGDLCRKYLIVEIMGKHSNIIFCNEDGMIIDSIKHISGMVSSVREVLPGREYFIPKTQEKMNPLECGEDVFYKLVFGKNMPLYKALMSSFTGFSNVIGQEICYLASVDGDMAAVAVTDEERQQALYTAFTQVLSHVRNGQYAPVIIYDRKEEKEADLASRPMPKEYNSFPLSIYYGFLTSEFSSVSELLQSYYAQKNAVSRIRQKSVDLRKLVQNAMERNVKKYDLQTRQMEDTQKRDKYKLYGELLTTYGYEAKQGDSSIEVVNYYTGETIKIPLDTQMSPLDNAKRYFEKYNKMKRTYEASLQLVEATKAEIAHLDSISTALDIARKEEDLVQIKEELVESGYIKRKGGGKKAKITSKPIHYISHDGFHIYVGKNNYQNEELTFKIANGGDWWFHAKGMPGSHVIVKSNGEELPDRTFEEAARLAAFYSKGRGADKIEVDYTQKKNVKKPAGGKPGFVVYYTNYSMIIDSDITELQEV